VNEIDEINPSRYMKAATYLEQGPWQADFPCPALWLRYGIPCSMVQVW